MIIQEPRRLTSEEEADLQQSENERLDLAALGQQATTEITYPEGDIDYLQTIIPSIDGMAATQVRTTVRELAERVLRLEQENLRIIKAMRYLVRHFAG